MEVSSETSDSIIRVILLDTVPNIIKLRQESPCIQRRDESLHCSLSSAYSFLPPSIIGRCKTDVTSLATPRLNINQSVVVA